MGTRSLGIWPRGGEITGGGSEIPGTPERTSGGGGGGAGGGGWGGGGGEIPKGGRAGRARSGLGIWPRGDEVPRDLAPVGTRSLGIWPRGGEITGGGGAKSLGHRNERVDCRCIKYLCRNSDLFQKIVLANLLLSVIFVTFCCK